MSAPKREVDVRTIRAVRVGHGANCSSIGSVIDTLFATAVVGSAIMAAVAAALSSEPLRVVGSDRRADDEPPKDADGKAAP